MIKAVIFDCFGVLYNDPSLDMMRQHLPEPTEEYFALSRSSDLGEISNPDYFAGLAKIAGISVEEATAIMEDTSHLNQELVDLIEKLKPHYKLGMLSNINTEYFQTFMNNENVKNLFDVIITSEEVGYMKPDKEIFEIILDRMGLKADEAVFIDDRQPNIDGANNLGLKSLLYKNTAQLKSELQKLDLNGL